MNEQRLISVGPRVVHAKVEEQGTKRAGGLVILARRAGRVGSERVVRDGTTGRIVSAVPVVAARVKVFVVPRVWAVAEPEPAHHEEAVVAWGPALLPIPGRSRAPEVARDAEVEPKGELAFYRKYTEGMLRRYLRLSTEAGRVPSLLGRELFRGNVTTYKVHSFEDVVIFCHDMETLLAKLRPIDQQLIKRIAMQQYTQGEAASMLRMNFRTCIRMYNRALDALTRMLLEGKMLEPLKSCQGGKSVGIAPSNSL